MRCSTKYVGLDVHQATTLVVVRDGNGKIIARSILPTEEAALLEFFVGMRGAVHVAFEEGTQAQWLHDLLLPRVARVVVCNRRGSPRQGNKGDWGDAGVISDLLRSNVTSTRGSERPGQGIARGSLIRVVRPAWSAEALA